jgi:DNA repair protein RadC
MHVSVEQEPWLTHSDAELIALIVAAGVRGREPIAVARELLDRAGDLRALLHGPLTVIRATPGIGPAGALRLCAAVEVGRRHLGGGVRARRALGSPTDAAAFLRARLADLGHEVFACLFLDTRHRVICFEPLFRGTLDGAAVYPREVLKRALHHNAGALILAHNHPSGDCEPSAADRSITDRLAKALALVDIRLLDHLVVSSEGHVSLAERGWI